MIVLSMCDRTGVMVKPWAEAGYECVCIDWQHPPGETVDGNITYVGADLHTWMPPYGEDYAIAFAFTDCTNMAVSGARWFKSKGLTALNQGVSLFDRARTICEAMGVPYSLENPVSTIASYWRKPDHVFNPCDYGGYLDPPGDAYTKKTCLWTGNGFAMPEPKPVQPTERSKMHLMPPSQERADLRSVTPAGFARAVFEANRIKLSESV